MAAIRAAVFAHYFTQIIQKDLISSHRAAATTHVENKMRGWGFHCQELDMSATDCHWVIFKALVFL